MKRNLSFFFFAFACNSLFFPLLFMECPAIHKICNFCCSFYFFAHFEITVWDYRNWKSSNEMVALSVFTCCLLYVCVCVNRLVSCCLVFDTTTRLSNGIHLRYILKATTFFFFVVVRNELNKSCWNSIWQILKYGKIHTQNQVYNFTEIGFGSSWKKNSFCWMKINISLSIVTRIKFNCIRKT